MNYYDYYTTTTRYNQPLLLLLLLKTSFNGRFGCGLGMVWEPLILGLVIFDLLLSLWLARMLVFSVQAEVSKLNTQIAEAIQGIVAQGIGDFEPPNPIQMAFAELLKSKLSETVQGDPVEILRASDGKFSG